MSSSEILFAEATVDLTSLNQSLSIEFGCQLVHCTVNIGTSLDPFLLGSDANDIELSFLDGLRASSGSTDPVIPKRLYVRESMRRIFGLFSTDANRASPRTRTVLVGSSGVGLSVLFFLAALHRSRSTSTMYFHSSYTTGEYIAVFLMCPGHGGEVNVLFTKNLSMLNANTSKRNLSAMQRLLVDQLKIERKKYFAFVDGPRHDDRFNVLDWKYDYFCTQGGHPPFRLSERPWSRLWVLDGWTEEEAIRGLATHGYGEDVAKEAYFLCGGSIRDMLQASTPEGYQQVRKSLDHAISLFVPNTLQIALVSSMRSQDSRDRVLTMFQASNLGISDLMIVVQWVDSGYAMGCLHKQLGLAEFFNNYVQNQWWFEEKTIPSFLFEHLIHSWFENKKPGSIVNVYWSREAGLTGLSKRNIYWIPRVVIPVNGAVAIVPIVNAAVIIDDTLHVLQITADTNYRVDFEALQACVEPIQGNFHLKFVVIYVLVPYKAKQSPRPKRVMLGKHSKHFCERHHINVRNVAGVDASLQRLASSIQTGNHGIAATVSGMARTILARVHRV
jgi:hypothetical protein